MAGRPGRSPAAARTAQAPAASGAVHRCLADAGSRRLKTSAPAEDPRAGAARIRPTATAPPPSVRASGAATPRAPTRGDAVFAPGAAAAGRLRTPQRTSSADAAKVAASAASEARTPANATTAPPAANPATWAN